eukprot:12415158-Karenia_brevis.AAC.1
MPTTEIKFTWSCQAYARTRRSRSWSCPSASARHGLRTISPDIRTDKNSRRANHREPSEKIAEELTQKLR